MTLPRGTRLYARRTTKHDASSPLVVVCDALSEGRVVPLEACVALAGEGFAVVWAEADDVEVLAHLAWVLAPDAMAAVVRTVAAVGRAVATRYEEWSDLVHHVAGCHFMCQQRRPYECDRTEACDTTAAFAAVRSVRRARAGGWEALSEASLASLVAPDFDYLRADETAWLARYVARCVAYAAPGGARHATYAATCAHAATLIRAAVPRPTLAALLAATHPSGP